MPIKTGQKNVTTSGTPVQIDAINLEGKQEVVVKAKNSNTGTITVGFSSATALNTSTSHFKLAAGDYVRVVLDDLDEVWIDATVSGEGIEYIADIK